MSQIWKVGVQMRHEEEVESELDRKVTKLFSITWTAVFRDLKTCNIH